MSKSVNIQLNISCQELALLDGVEMPFVFDEANARDIIEHVIKANHIPGTFTFLVKYRSSDLFGNPRIVTLSPSSFIMDGQTYYLFISPLIDEDANTLELSSAPPTPGTMFASPVLNTLTNGSSFLRTSPETPGASHENAASQSRPGTSKSASASQAFKRVNVNESPRTSHGRLGTRLNDNQSGNHYELFALDSCQTTRANSASTENEIPPVLPRQLHPTQPVNKALFLGDLYNQNNSTMDAVFLTMKPDEPFFYHGIDIMKRMTFPRYIAAFTLIKKVTWTDYDIRVGNIARETAQKFTVDIFMEASRKEKMPRTAAQPLMDFLSLITDDGSFFFWIMRSNGSLVEAVRKRDERQQLAKGFLPRKKIKLMFTEEDLEDVDKAANAAAEAHTREEKMAVIEKSSAVRCQWILTLVQANKIQIPELVVAKFPMFKTNASWLKYDFAYTMENVYKQPTFDVSETLRLHAQAIAAVAVDTQVISLADTMEVENDLIKTASTLLDLLCVYMKRNNSAKIDRLVIEAQELPSVDEMIAQRRALKQTGPMIFVIDTSQGKEFYVSTDDFALYVPGDFGKALQSLVALHFVVYIEYAKDLLNFHLFLENLCERNTNKMNKCRQNLLFDLKNKLRVISDANASNES